MPENEPDSGEQVKFTIKTPEGAPYVYIDHVNVSLNFFGIKLLLGTMDAIQASENERTITTNVQVALSVEHAQALHELLGRQLVAYEEKWGPVRQIPQLATEGDVPPSP